MVLSSSCLDLDCSLLTRLAPRIVCTSLLSLSVSSGPQDLCRLSTIQLPLCHQSVTAFTARPSMKGSTAMHGAAIGSTSSEGEERSATPPPPYDFEDIPPYSSSATHDPECVELDSGIPYQVRGWLVLCYQASDTPLQGLTFIKMMAVWTSIWALGRREPSHCCSRFL